MPGPYVKPITSESLGAESWASVWLKSSLGDANVQPELRTTNMRDTEVEEPGILLMGEDVEGSFKGSSGVRDIVRSAACLVKVGHGILWEAGRFGCLVDAGVRSAVGEGSRAARRGFSGFATLLRGSGYLTNSTHLLSPLLSV